MSSYPLAANQIRPETNPLDEAAKALSIKGMLQGQQSQQLEQQSQSLGIQQQQQQLADQRAMTQAMSQWDGKDIEELPALVLKNGGSANAVFGVRSQILNQKQTLSKIAADDAETGAKNIETYQKRADSIAGPLESLTDKNSVSDADLPNEAKTTINSLAASGLIDGPHAQSLSSFVDANAQNPDALRQGIDHYAKTHLAASQIADLAQKQSGTLKNYADQFKEIPGTGAFWNPNTDELKTPDGQVMSQAMAESKFLQIDQARKLGNPVSKQDQAFSDAYKDMKTMVPQFNLNMQAGLLNDNALDMAAKNYLTTGQMPTGLRSSGMSSAIINRAGELSKSDPSLANIAENKAAYKANSESLDSLQKNFDQVTAFENTAGKNLDQFLGVAKNVIDSGSPWVNKPLRTVGQQGLGSADLTAYNAARQTALTEIAKVLSSSNASGVLSDSARGEVSQLIGPNATLKQVYAAANILKQDMANRHDSYQQQISDIKSRFNISGNAPQQTTPGGAIPPAVSKVLEGVGPGIHKLSDGSSWMKAADGTVTPYGAK